MYFKYVLGGFDHVFWEESAVVSCGRNPYLLIAYLLIIRTSSAAVF
jgi:hypothetical protein